MLADIATRKGAKLEDINCNSEWINGSEWMYFNEEDFPTKTVSQIILNSTNLNEVKKEATIECNQHKGYFSLSSKVLTSLPAEVQERYSFSKFLIDPNKFRFHHVLRILGHVI